MKWNTLNISHETIKKFVSSGDICIDATAGRGFDSVCTHADTSIMAIDKGLNLLKDNGIMSLCIYYGKDTGFTERDAILNHLQTIDSKKYTVLVTNFSNRPNCPPIFALIIKAI